jgi:hypothetical protein
MHAASTALFVLAYLLAVVDGAMQDRGLYPSPAGRMGFRMFMQKHPWIVAGAACGVVAAILDA